MAGLSYADATGNIRIALAEPPIYLELAGAETNPWAEDRPLRSLRGSGSARVVRALLDFQPPYSLRGLAQKADLPLATASRVIAYLDREALLERTGRGPIRSVDWKALLKRWAQDYGLLASNTVEYFLEPRGLEALLPKLSDLDAEYAITGSLAAMTRAAIATPALAAIYVRDVERASKDLQVQPSTVGNVALIVPQSEVAFERTWAKDDLIYAALSQVAVDLMTGPGRSPSEAVALIDWMEKNVDEWRRT